MKLKQPDKKTKAEITKETLAIWEMGFRAGYESCIEDANDLEIQEQKIEKNKKENRK